ncbi:MAG TPA: peptide-methionine (S)-S-oxide reductase MsrA [Gemmatimonadaceae bacterium]|nr:peptide-methionine (S)-S-oxide reductase MsrA [Gemmatimonadaceae bacterium]
MIRSFIAAFAATVVLSSAGAAQSAQLSNAGTSAALVAPAAPLDTAVFGGGCFWCMEPPFDRLSGVISTTSGYAGGTLLNPTYKQVSNGGTGHVEVVRVIYDPARVSYARLLDVFWRNIDPLTANRQFCDAGDQYRSAIFFQNEAQRAASIASKTAIERSRRFNRPIVTEITARARFYPAEEYHQDYYTKNPVRYKFYRGRCGRDERLKELWGKPVA